MNSNWFSNRKNKNNKDIVWTPRLLLKRRNLLYRDSHNWQISNYVPKWIISQFVERGEDDIFGYLFDNDFKYNR